MPLLSDVDGTATAAYGIGLPGLGPRRSVFLVDADGAMRWRHVALLGLTYPTIQALTGHLAALQDSIR